MLPFLASQHMPWQGLVVDGVPVNVWVSPEAKATHEAAVAASTGGKATGKGTKGFGKGAKGKGGGKGKGEHLPPVPCAAPVCGLMISAGFTWCRCGTRRPAAPPQPTTAELQEEKRLNEAKEARKQRKREAKKGRGKATAGTGAATLQTRPAKRWRRTRTKKGRRSCRSR